MSLQFVFARYNESVDWLETTSANIIIYNKGNPLHYLKNVISLPNVGRESHTYLYHIINNYNNLADFTFFTQAALTDHGYPQDINVLEEFIRRNIVSGYTNNYHYHGDNHFAAPDFNRRIKWLLIDKYKAPPETVDCVLFCDWFTKYIEPTYPDKLLWYTGGIFGISKERILSRPKEYYQVLYDMLSLENAPIEGHFMERSWFYIFNCHN